MLKMWQVPSCRLPRLIISLHTGFRDDYPRGPVRVPYNISSKMNSPWKEVWQRYESKPQFLSWYLSTGSVQFTRRCFVASCWTSRSMRVFAKRTSAWWGRTTWMCLCNVVPAIKQRIVYFVCMNLVGGFFASSKWCSWCYMFCIISLFPLSKVKRRAFHLLDVCCWLIMVGNGGSCFCSQAVTAKQSLMGGRKIMIQQQPIL